MAEQLPDLVTLIKWVNPALRALIPADGKWHRVELYAKVEGEGLLVARPLTIHAHGLGEISATDVAYLSGGVGSEAENDAQ